MSSQAPAVSVDLSGRATRARSSFFLAAHLALLAVVLLGFAPSFYLRPAFHHVTHLPVLLELHGAVLTLWFCLTVVQAALIRTRRLQWHRRLGYALAGYAAVVILFGILADLRLIGEIDSAHDGENIVVWGNFFTLLMYAACVSLAVLLRNRPDAHKRLVLLASMSIVGPALARFPRWPMFAGGPEAGKNYAIAGLLILFALLLAYDVVTRRRPHPASLAGMAGLLLSIAGGVYLGVSGIGYHLLHG